MAVTVLLSGCGDKRLKTKAMEKHSPGTPRLQEETVPALVHPDLLQWFASITKQSLVYTAAHNKKDYPTIKVVQTIQFIL